MKIKKEEFVEAGEIEKLGKDSLIQSYTKAEKDK